MKIHLNHLLDDILINSSDYVLKVDEIRLLTKGLTFAPVRRPRAEQLHKDLERLRRKLNLRAAWSENGSLSAGKGICRSKLGDVLVSDWDPPETIKVEDSIWTKFRDTCISHSATSRPKPNLPKNWQETWNGLTNNPLFYLLQADKGGRMVLWPREAYEREAFRQLEDATTYKEITLNEATKEMANLHWTRLNLSRTLVMEKCITKTEAKRLTEREWEIPGIYFLPKVHKKKLAETGSYAGRPILAAVKGPLKALDEYLANLTRPLLKMIPGSLQDTRDLLNALENLGTIPKEAILFSADVEALYPSIPWEEGLKAATDFYAEHFERLKEVLTQENRLPPPSPSTFHRILYLIITRNYFHYQNKRWFYQLKGTAMGCSISVYLANTFMYKRTRYLLNHPPGNLLFLGRYIDDLVGVWLGETKDVVTCLSGATDDSIRLTYVLNPEELEALDVKIRLDGGKIITRLFRKPTDGHQFLDWASNHPRSLKKSIPYSQLLRVKRNCSRESDFAEEAGLLLDRFRRRGYPDETLNRALQKAKEVERRSLLESQPKEETTEVLTFVTTYDTMTENVMRKAVQVLLEDLIKSEHNQKLKLPENLQARVAFRVDRALGDSIGNSFKRGGNKNLINQQCVYRAFFQAGREEEETAGTVDV